MDALHAERSSLSLTARRLAIDDVTITSWVRTSLTIDVSLTPTMEAQKKDYEARVRAFRLECDTSYNRLARLPGRLRQVLEDFKI